MNTWTILFDIDGTLTTSSGAGMGAMEVTVKQLYGIGGIPEISVHGRTDKSILHELFTAIEVEHDGTFEQFNQQYCLNLPQSLRDRDARLLPGVEPLLKELASLKHVELGLLTGNLKQAAEIKLRNVGIDHYFSFGGYGDHHADRNDVAVEAVENARAVIGNHFSAEHLWVIGDTANDIRCARHVGAKVIAVETGGESAELLEKAAPDLQMRDLTEAGNWCGRLSP